MPYKKTNSRLAAAFAVSLPLALYLPSLSGEDFPVATYGGPDTLVAYAQNSQLSTDKKVSFVLNLSSYGLGDFWRFLNGTLKNIAVIFDANKATGTCPFLDLTDRDYKIIQIHPTDYIYRIEVASSQEEVDAGLKAGCMITTLPSLSKVELYQKKQPPPGSGFRPY